MSKNKKTAEISTSTSDRPKLARPSKPMSSYTSADELKLIIQRAHALGDTEYATLAEERLLEIKPAPVAAATKKAARSAKAELTA